MPMSTRSFRLIACLYLVGLCLVGPGCTEEADIPDVPDLEALQEQFDEPTAELDGSNARAIVDAYPELERYAAALESTDPLLGKIEDARRATNQRSGRGVKLRGGLTITTGCPGADREAHYDDPANGSVTFQLAVDEGRIKQAFWATAVRCVLRATLGSTVFPLELDGRVAFDVGAPIELGVSWQRGRALVSLEGTLGGDALTLSGVSARLGTENEVEYLQELADGSVVLFVTNDGIGLRDRDTTWFCERGSAACGTR